ncbi:Dinitrogenase iron-molybdenum cofactor biosynthesis protein [Denitrovibrio acetiphilus DSM 12809]|uniref:Dinitrogenase iron-molybdenum cofactor biosynthesis protein n=1 Tax=Denitrovibrio acetiphilus (strain DSM 12809 / NBRC 114555 / N2460) TaxID=522772 RepID=D4H3J4_DENA2|nr:NifB/NifX family molybdenum-iron cluster-binding protein [Denitrovibrio acetiphilus]ADD69096.1 Dinitrogenase iron-molybdenum cofactor biosynthesis protein [Denitrovibrio acetiphilus DSM 12809]
MKVCFPVEQNDGAASSVYGHFGSAPGFVVYDTETEELDFINNSDVAHEHGACNPVAALAGRSVDAIVVGGIGQGAIAKLMQDGIQVMRSASGIVEDDIKLYVKGELENLTMNMETCSHSSHSCSH